MGDNLPPCNLQEVLSKDINFKAKVGHYGSQWELKFTVTWDNMKMR
jgi:hypothetical protein